MDPLHHTGIITNSPAPTAIVPSIFTVKNKLFSLRYLYILRAVEMSRRSFKVIRLVAKRQQ